MKGRAWLVRAEFVGGARAHVVVTGDNEGEAGYRAGRIFRRIHPELESAELVDFNVWAVDRGDLMAPRRRARKRGQPVAPD